jgi:hypothetical protein
VHSHVLHIVLRLAVLGFGVSLSTGVFMYGCFGQFEISRTELPEVLLGTLDTALWVISRGGSSASRCGR